MAFFISSYFCIDLIANCYFCCSLNYSNIDLLYSTFICLSSNCFRFIFSASSAFNLASSSLRSYALLIFSIFYDLSIYVYFKWAYLWASLFSINYFCYSNSSYYYLIFASVIFLCSSYFKRLASSFILIYFYLSASYFL